jgi:hypothetical protein
MVCDLRTVLGYVSRKSKHCLFLLPAVEIKKYVRYRVHKKLVALLSSTLASSRFESM